MTELLETDRLYRDVNDNGVVDPDTDILLATDVTDAGGLYTFTRLAGAGAHYIVLLDETGLPAGYTQTGDPDEDPGACTTCDAKGLVTLVASVFDMLDGRVARLRGRGTRFGAYLDSTMDRYSDMGLFMGLMILYARVDRTPEMVLVWVAAFGSFMTSYARARAESLIPQCTVGFLERPERIVLQVGRMLAGFDRRGDFRRFAGKLADTGIAGTETHYPFFAETAFWLARRYPAHLLVDWPELSVKQEEMLLERLSVIAHCAETPGLEEAPLTLRECPELSQAGPPR